MGDPSNSDSCTENSPTVRNNNPSGLGARKSFLTPCRRLGLSRRSPVSTSKMMHSHKSPLQMKSPEPNYSPSALDTKCTSHSGITKTPSRPMLSRVPSKNLHKKLKSSHPNDHISSISPKEIEEKCKDTTQADTKQNSPELKSLEETNPPIKYEIKDGKINGQEVTREMIEEVKLRINLKEDKLKDLKQAEIYQKKHDPQVLRKLIQTWREGCQSALSALSSDLRARGVEANIENLLKEFNIPFEFVKYNPDLEEFE